MTIHVDQQRWEGLIRQPDWYLVLVPEIAAIRKQANEQGSEQIKEYAAYKQEVYDFFERHLVAGDIVLGTEVGIWDRERKPIDTVVIHHTSAEPGISPVRLSAIELIRLYATHYANPIAGEESIRGTPISSGHMRNGQQIFWPYHWIVRTDGSAERLLEDKEVGWQAGKWDVNCRSVAVVLDSDYEHARPSDMELGAIAKIIRTHYPQISKEKIIGHRQVNPKTTCPSELFLSNADQHGWREDIIKRPGLLEYTRPNRFGYHTTMQLQPLHAKFDRLQRRFGDPSLSSIYGAGCDKNATAMFIFMNPTARNISAQKSWKGLRAPWLGTKTVWSIFHQLRLLPSSSFKRTQELKPGQWDKDFAYGIYSELENRKIFVTNLAKCTQLDARSLSNDVFKNYRELMLEEIMAVNPRHIISFGNQVSSILLGRPISVGDYAGNKDERLRICNKFFKVYPTYYPVGQGRRNLPLAIKRIKSILNTKR